MRRSRRTALQIVAAALLLLVSALPAQAQEFNEIQVVIKPQLNIEQSRRIRHIVRDIGGKRWASANRGGQTDSVVMEPAGYTIVPTADLVTAETETAAGWNVWLDGSGGIVEDTNPIRAYDGTQLSISLGADTQASEKLTLGVILNHSATDVTNVFTPATSTTSGISVGPYAALFLADTLVLTGSFLYTWRDNDADSADASASYNSEGWAVNGTLTHYHITGNWTLAPSIGVSYNREDDDAYTDTGIVPTSFAASTSKTGTFAFGGSASYTHVLDNGMTVEPALSLEGEWTFLRRVSATSSVPANTQDLDMNITGSIDFQLSQSSSLSLSSTASGLANPDYLSVIGGGRLSVSF